MKKIFKSKLCSFLIIVVVFVLFACSNKEQINESVDETIESSAKSVSGISSKDLKEGNEVLVDAVYKSEWEIGHHQKHLEAQQKLIDEELWNDYCMWEKEPMIVSADGETCYVLDYYGGKIPEKYSKFKKLDFSRNRAPYIRNMEFMFGDFWDAYEVEEVNLTGLNTEMCTTMAHLFENCNKLKKVNFGNIDTSNVTDMYKMFCECTSLEEIKNFKPDTSKVKSMRGMFFKNISLKSLDVSSFDVGNVEDMSYMFYKCNKLTSLDVSKFAPKKCTAFVFTFGNCNNVKDFDLSNFVTASASDMSQMFFNCNTIENLDFSKFKTNGVGSFFKFLSGCKNLKNVNVSSFDTSKTSQFEYMFEGCENLKNIDVSNFITDNAYGYIGMFKDCKKLENINVKNFKMYNRTNALVAFSIGSMFENCESLKELDLSSFNNNNYKIGMTSAFAYCENLEKLDISNIDLSNITGEYIFDGCYKLKNLIYNKSSLPKIENKDEKLYEGHIVAQINRLDNIDNYKLAYVRKKILYNKDLMEFDSDSWLKACTNEFIVKKKSDLNEDRGRDYKEFFEYYEKNTYDHFPNFVTTDSLLHVYHLYFDYLMKKIEKERLYENVKNVTEKLYDISKKYYTECKGTVFEDAAKVNVAYFAVPLSIIDSSFVPEDYVKEMVEKEMMLINDHSNIEVKPIFYKYYDALISNGADYKVIADIYMDDYSQYKVRGHYDGDEILEKYFKIFMWYGRTNFSNLDDNLNRSALLMSYALNDSDMMDKYKNIKDVIYYFAGHSDDCGPDEYYKVLNNIYKKKNFDKSIVNDAEKFETFKTEIKKLSASRINSAPEMYETRENPVNFRLIGQTYTYDAEMFRDLIYDYVKKKTVGDTEYKRVLPDFLDVPAALNSETAKKLLHEVKEKNGLTAYDYPNYEENLNILNNTMPKAIKEDNSDILYVKWMKALYRLIENEDKNESYPSFMKNDEWKKKRLETFGGSYAELKHDTILYAKQTYGAAEKGEGGLSEFFDSETIEYDDKGYVEPEVEVYNELYLLANNMKEKFGKMEMIGDTDKEFLDNFATLSLKLKAISEKELKNENLSDEEYELIRGYGGDIEHLIIDSGAYEYDSIYAKSNAIVADIATGEDGGMYYAREIATGNPIKMYVLVKVEDKYKVCAGAVFDFYQFEVPIADRMTDIEWRTSMGFDTDLIVDAKAEVKSPWEDDYVDVTYKSDKDAKFEFQSWTNSYKYGGAYCGNKDGVVTNIILDVGSEEEWW